MAEKKPRNRWSVVVIFFFFMLLHQTDKLLIGPLKGPISEEFGITNTQFGMVISGALIVGTILYPIWGYLYDRFARAKLLALASFIWGATTWLSAVVRTYGGFVATRASTGVDDSSYPGLYSLVADYFEPDHPIQGLRHPAVQPADRLPAGDGAGPDGRPGAGLAECVLHHRRAGDRDRHRDLLRRQRDATRQIRA